MSDTIRVQFALVCEKKIDEENMDEIHSFTTSPRPRIDIHVYFLQVCRPFSWNAVYLQRNVISRVIAIETPQVWLQFLRVSPYIPSREKNLDVDINASFIPRTYFSLFLD